MQYVEWFNQEIQSNPYLAICMILCLEFLFLLIFLRLFRHQIKEFREERKRKSKDALERNMAEAIERYAQEVYRINSKKASEQRKQLENFYKTHGYSYRYSDDLPRIIGRLNNSQKKMQEDIEKMNFLLSSIVVNKNSNTHQEGIDAAKLLEQMAKMTNADYLLELLRNSKESKYKAMDNVIKDVSHAIKTPISGISVSLMMLKSQGFEDDDVIERLNDIEKSIEQIETNLSAYRNLMDMNLGGDKGSNSSFASKVSARLKIAVLSSEKTLYIDASGIEDVFVSAQTANLILLALDCIIENATFFALDNSTIRASGKIDDGIYSLIIENDGPTISANDAKKIFEDGYSTHASSGKGLFIVKSVISDRLGGEIDFENIESPKPGVRFTLMLDKNRLGIQEREMEHNGESIDSGR